MGGRPRLVARASRPWDCVFAQNLICARSGTAHRILRESSLITSVFPTANPRTLMAELTLHFEAIPGTDLAAAALELQKAMAEVQGVQSAEAKPQQFQGIDIAEIFAVAKLAGSYAEDVASLLTAIVALRDAWKKAKRLFPGLRSPTVEVGLKKIPIDQITAAHVQQITSDE
jgi:hypothetical protein